MSARSRVESAKTWGDHQGPSCGCEAEESGGGACTGDGTAQAASAPTRRFRDLMPLRLFGPGVYGVRSRLGAPSHPHVRTVAAARSLSVPPLGSGRTPKANTSGRA